MRPCVTCWRACAAQALAENDIYTLVLPPNTSHRLQPLDRAVFAPLKRAYEKDKQCRLLKLAEPKLSNLERVHVLESALSSVMAAENLRSGFRVAGIWPRSALADALERCKTEASMEPEQAAAAAAEGEERWDTAALTLPAAPPPAVKRKVRVDGMVSKVCTPAHLAQLAAEKRAEREKKEQEQAARKGKRSRKGASKQGEDAQQAPAADGGAPAAEESTAPAPTVVVAPPPAPIASPPTDPDRARPQKKRRTRYDARAPRARSRCACSRSLRPPEASNG